MTTTIIDRDEFIVVGIRMLLDSDSRILETLNRFMSRKAEVKSVDGLIHGVFNIIPGRGGVSYECVAGLTAHSLEDIPEGMVGWIIPIGKYAQIETIGIAGVAGACQAVMAEWLPQSGYNMAESPVFINSDSGRPDSPDAIWRIHIPLEKPGELAQLKQWIA